MFIYFYIQNVNYGEMYQFDKFLEPKITFMNYVTADRSTIPKLSCLEVDQDT